MLKRASYSYIRDKLRLQQTLRKATTLGGRGSPQSTAFQPLANHQRQSWRAHATPGATADEIIGDPVKALEIIDLGGGGVESRNIKACNDLQALLRLMRSLNNPPGPSTISEAMCRAAHLFRSQRQQQRKKGQRESKTADSEATLPALVTILLPFSLTAIEVNSPMLRFHSASGADLDLLTLQRATWPQLSRMLWSFAVLQCHPGLPCLEASGFAIEALKISLIVKTHSFCLPVIQNRQPWTAPAELLGSDLLSLPLWR